MTPVDGGWSFAAVDDWPQQRGYSKRGGNGIFQFRKGNLDRIVMDIHLLGKIILILAVG
jgi:hypothetical protein